MDCFKESSMLPLFNIPPRSIQKGLYSASLAVSATCKWAVGCRDYPCYTATQSKKTDASYVEGRFRTSCIEAETSMIQGVRIRVVVQALATNSATKHIIASSAQYKKLPRVIYWQSNKATKLLALHKPLKSLQTSPLKTKTLTNGLRMFLAVCACRHKRYGNKQYLQKTSAEF